MNLDEMDWKLLSELMKNSQRSDRDLAGELGCSQSTVSRRRRRLEKNGYIREYTMIPDFAKLGYDLMALTFANAKADVTPEEMEDIRGQIRKEILQSPFDFIMVERGKGVGYESVVISLHKDYGSFNRFRLRARELPFLQFNTQSFLISLEDKVRYLPLTLKNVAKHMSPTTKENLQ